MAGKPLPEGVIRKACEQECANLMVKSWQRFVGRAWTQAGAQAMSRNDKGMCIADGCDEKPTHALRVSISSGSGGQPFGRDACIEEMLLCEQHADQLEAIPYGRYHPKRLPA